MIGSGIILREQAGKLIDWLQFKKKHGVRVSFTERQGETQFDIEEYWVDIGSKKSGGTREDSDLSFKQLCEIHDTEGSGADRKVWLPDRKKRMRDVTRYVDNVAEEGGKVLKDPSTEERQHTRQIALDSAPGHDAKFFLQPQAQATPKKSSGEVDDASSLPGTSTTGGSSLSLGGKKQKRIDLSEEVPRQKMKLKKLVDSAFEPFEESIKAVKAELQKVVDGDNHGDSELEAYVENAHFRLGVARAMLVETKEIGQRCLNNEEVDVEVSAAILEEGEAPKKAAEAGEGGGVDAAKAEGAVAEAADAAAAQAEAAEPAANGAKAAVAKEVDDKASSNGDRNTRRYAAVTNLIISRIQGAGWRAAIVHDPTALMCKYHLLQLVQDMQQVASAADLCNLVDMITKACAQVKALVASLKGAAKKVETQMKTIEKKKVDVVTKKSKDEDKAIEDAEKAKAKTAAAAIAAAEKELSPLFNIDYATLVTESVIKAVQIFADLSEPEKMDTTAPCKVNCFSDVEQMSKAPKMQVSLGNFGGRYKKKQGHDTDGRVQMTLYGNEGREDRCIIYLYIYI